MKAKAHAKDNRLKQRSNVSLKLVEVLGIEVVCLPWSWLMSAMLLHISGTAQPTPLHAASSCALELVDFQAALHES